MGGNEQGQQAPPPPPSASQGIGEYIENYPRLIEAQEKYGARDLESQRAAQAQAYPELEALRGELIGQVGRGISEEAPDWYMEKSRDYISSVLGDQVTGGLGLQNFTTGMLEQQKNWNDYYRNMAMSFSGNQPVYQANAATQNFTPGQVMASNTAGYSPYVGAWGGQQGRQFNQGQYNQNTPWRAAEGVGNLMGGMAGQGGGFMGWGT